MDERESKIIEIVNNENVSATVILADRLDTTPEEVISILQEAIDSGRIEGTLTEDGSRFFKSDVKLSEAPVIPLIDEGPSFIKFNTRPGIVTSLLGVIVIVAGLIVDAIAMDMIEQGFGVILVFFGIIILFSGLYCLSRRKTPA
ncbi:MAG: hypothetical protein ACFFEE_13630 [Candidatus Thorarchaeota archaeon]